MKRIIAGLLCATMLFSMDGYRNVSYAAGTDSYSIVEASSADPVLEAASSSTSSEDPNTQENNGDAASGGAATDASTSAGAGEESSQKPSDEASEDKSAAGETDASTDATSEEKSDAADEATSTASADGEEAADAASSASTVEEVADAASSASSDDEAALSISVDELDKSLLLNESKLTSVNDNRNIKADENGKLVVVDKSRLGNDIVIPADVTIIPSGIFNRNQNIEIIRFEAGSKLTTIEAGAFEDSSLEIITIPEGVTEIKDDTFKNAASLREVTFKGSITTIGDEAFSNTSIVSINIPKVTTIGNYAFLGCSSLKYVSGSKLVSIGRAAFSGCSSLLDMTFGSTIKSIGNNAFANCISLTSIDLRAMKSTFNGELSEGYIGANVFQNCSGIETAYLPENLVAIPAKTFSGCSRLKNVYIYDGTAKVANNAFERCTSLETITFPQVRDFGTDAFDGCSAIKTIYIRYDGKENISIIEDAFPLKSGVTLYGYREEIQAYAEKRGYAFSSLTQKYPIEVKIVGGSAGYKLSTKEAGEGDKVNLTITPAKGYELKNIEINQTRPIEEKKIELVETTATSQTFSFQMLGGKEIVEVNLVEKGKSITGNITALVRGILDEEHDYDYKPEYSSESDEYIFDISGRKAQLVVKDGNRETKSWLWNYTSSNAKVATITSMGVIRTAGKGNAIITATLKSDTRKKVSVPIIVDDTASISNIVLKILDTPRAMKGHSDLNKGDDGEIPVVQYEKSVIANNNMSFDVDIEAFASDSADKLVVKSVWSSTDPKIATVAANSTTNKNTVKIVKGAVGETLITVSVLNADQKTADPANTKSFIVRVVDATPRLVNGNITVDSNSTEGTLLDIRTVYGIEIAANRLELCTKKKDSKGVVTYPVFKGLSVGHGNESDSDKYYIFNSNPDKPFTATYTGATQLYLTGTYKSENGKGDTFYIPVPKITVTNTALNPTIKTTGKINLFYNSSADSSLSGVVKVSQSLTKLAVKDVQLVSAANNKKAGSETPDTFAANFKVENIDNKTFEITRTSTDMKKVGNKNVVSGFIYIWYEGYASPVKRAITVPVVDVAPEYVLNVASATASGFSKNQKYELQLVDKKTKKNVVDLSSIDANLSDSNNIIGLGLDGNSTQDLFKDLDMEAVQKAKESDTITLSIDGQPRNGTAYIYVRMTTWSRRLTYKFTVNASRALPTVKLSATNATLNKTYPKQAATIKLSQNQPEAKLVKGKIRYVGKNKKLADTAELLIKSMEYDGDTIKVNLPEKTRDGANDVALGTYNFNVIPDVTYDGVEDLDCKAVAFNVVVTQTSPTLKLNNPTFVLNANTPGVEEYTRTYVIGNLPTGVTGIVDDSSVDYVPVGAIPELDKLGTIKFANGKAVAQLFNNNTVVLNAGKTLKYKVHGLKVRCEYKDENGQDKVEESTIPDFVINLQLTKAAAAVKVTAAGTINPVDPTSKITYKAAVSNIVSDIDTVDVWEKDENNNYYKREAGTKDYYSKHFEIAKDAANSKVSYLKVKAGETLTNNKKYNITVVYTLKSVPDKPYYANFTVVPKQTLPAITTDKTAATLYAGQKNRTVKVKISKKAKPVINATFDTPDFAAGTSAAIKKAFKIADFDETTGVMTLELVNPSALVQNKDYTISFVTSYKNQAKGSTGNKFNLKVTLKK